MDQESRTFWFCIFVLFTPVALSPEEPLSRSVLDNVLKEFKERALGNEKETYNRAEQSTYSACRETIFSTLNESDVEDCSCDDMPEEGFTFTCRNPPKYAISLNRVGNTFTAVCNEDSIVYQPAMYNEALDVFIESIHLPNCDNNRLVAATNGMARNLLDIEPIFDNVHYPIISINLVNNRTKLLRIFFAKYDMSRLSKLFEILREARSVEVLAIGESESEPLDIDIKDYNLTNVPVLGELCPRLRALKLSHIAVYLPGNATEYVITTMLHKSEMLTDVVLEFNGLRWIPENFLQHAKHLKSLVIKESFLYSIHPEAFHHAQLRNLTLTTVDWTDCLRTELFSAICAITFESDLSGLPNLRKLQILQLVEIQTNPLKNLTSPLLFGTQPNLRILDLSFNAIAEISDAIFSNMSSRIEKLDLSHNRISFFNCTIFRYLTGLQELYLNGNHIQLIDDTFYTYSPKTLSVLSLSSNNLTSLSMNVFCKLEGLRTLNVRDNSISEITDNCSQPMVREFDIFSNQLADRDTKKLLLLFSANNRIEKIDLSQNKIEYVWMPTFYNHQKPVTIDLILNDIKSISLDNTIENDYNISNDTDNVNIRISSNFSLFINSGFIHCDCDLYQFYKIDMQQDYGEPQCATPNEYEYTSLRDMKAENFICDVECQPCSCYYRPHDSALFVDCSNRTFTQMPKILTKFMNETTLKEVLITGSRWNRSLGDTTLHNVVIGLENNRLQDFNSLEPLFQMYFNNSIYYHIYLDNNNISHLPTLSGLSASQHSPLLYLSLRNNQIPTIPLTFLKYFETPITTSYTQKYGNRTRKLLLSGNPFNCTRETCCGWRDAKNWLTTNSHLVVDSNDTFLTRDGVELKLVGLPDREICSVNNEWWTLSIIAFSLLFISALVIVFYGYDKSIVTISYKELAEATEDFNETGKIGNGAFGDVYFGRWREHEVAVKRLKDTTTKKKALKEYKMLNVSRCESIIPLYGISLDGPRICLVYQRLRMSLAQYLLDNQTLRDWDVTFKIAEGIAKGIHFLHSRKKPLVHGDIKPANILLDDQLKPKLADFGISRVAHSGIASILDVLLSTHGTAAYIAPEYWKDKDFSPAVDIYSYGVVVLEMALGMEAIAPAEKGHITPLAVKAMEQFPGVDRPEKKFLLQVGIPCVLFKPRPTSGQVLEMFKNLHGINKDMDDQVAARYLSILQTSV